MSKTLIPWKKKRASLARQREFTDPFEALQERVQGLFDEFNEEFGLARRLFPRRAEREWGLVNPRFEVAETDDQIEVSAELPGLDEKDIEVTLEDNLLTVRGEKKEEKEEKKKNYYLSERTYGEFQRVLPLPAGIDEDQVQARFKKGVLTITLPKTAEARAKGKHIDVSAE